MTNRNPFLGEKWVQRKQNYTVPEIEYVEALKHSCQNYLLETEQVI
jgi:hypothetical protein